MTTPEELGMIQPAGQDYINKGDDAISQNARATAAAYDVLNGLRWNRLEVPAGSLDTLFTAGVYYADTSAKAAAVTGKPNDSAFNSPFKVTVETVSVTNGITKQTIEAKIVGGGSGVSYERWSLSKTFYEWGRTGSQDGGGDLNTAYVSVFGDSQSEASAGTSWPEYAAAKLNGSTFINYARSGDNSYEILTRAGIVRPWFTVVGGIIPASGTVDIKTSMRLDFRAERSIVGGTLAGVGGALYHVGNDVFQFIRSTPGTAVSVSGQRQFVSSVATAAKTIVFWFGGNDFNGGMQGQERDIADRVIGAYRTAVEWAYANGRTPVIAGVTNRLNALTGSDGFAQVQRVNRELRRMYPDIFLDVQGYYVERAIYDAGLAPYSADLAAMLRGEIPPQLYLSGDDVHFTEAAHKAIAEKWIAPWLAAKGMAFTTTALPVLPALHPADQVTQSTETGWRDVSGWLPAGCVGTLYVNRVGGMVRAILQLTEIPTATVSKANAVPVGFRSRNSRFSELLVNYGDAVPLGSFAANSSGTITIYDPVAKPAGTIGMDFFWFTTDAWPTVLPGTVV